MASKFQTKVIKHYEDNGWLVINLIKASKAGFADLICFKEGHAPIFIECKEKNDKESPLQNYRGRQVEKYGCEYKLLKDGKTEIKL